MTQSPNQFKQSVILGMLDLRFNSETLSCEVVSTYSGDAMVPGQAVKLSDVGGGIPKVEACTADSDEVFGFINYDIKNKSFVAGDKLEVSRESNVMYLHAAEPISRGAQVCLYLADGDGYVANLLDGKRIVGYALDKATAEGDLIRVVLSTPSFSVYSA